MWYCHVCLPTLPSYMPAAGVRDALEIIDKKLENVAKMIASTNSNVKSYAQALSETGAAVVDPKLTEVKDLAEKLGSRLRQDEQDKEKQIRKVSAILHNIPEEENTHNVVFDTMTDLYIHHNTVTEISRLGKKKSTYSKPRPIRIQFASEIIKLDFLRRYVKYEHKEDSFATTDIPPEMRDIEFKLRIKKRELSKEHTGEKYQIRSGKLYQLDKKQNFWNLLEIDISTIEAPEKGTANASH